MSSAQINQMLSKTIMIIINLDNNGIYHFKLFFPTCNAPVLDLGHKYIERLIALFLDSWHQEDLSPPSVLLIDLSKSSSPKCPHQSLGEATDPLRRILLGELFSI